MNRYLAIYTLGMRYGLDGRQIQRLFRLAGLGVEPPEFSRRLSLGFGVLGAALVGFGLILWIAANWDTLSRFGQFGLLQGVTLAAGFGAMLHTRARPIWGTLSFLGIGATLAYFGQTYQTGADPWQLFALWALPGLPLALGIRSEILWVPWTLVVMTALALWEQNHWGLSEWNLHREPVPILIAWSGVALMLAWLSPPVGRLTGAGLGSLRMAATLGTILILSTALPGLFSQPVAAHYGLGLAFLGILIAFFSHPRFFDIGTLSALALGLDTLLVVGLARALLETGLQRTGLIPILFFLGLSAAVLVAISIATLLRLAHARQGSAL